jgi:hypothetical protein
MSRTPIPIYTLNRDGYAPVAAVNGDPTNDMYFDGNNGYCWVEIDNPGSVSVQVGAVLTTNVIDEVVVPDKIVTLNPGTAGFHFGPFPKGLYNHGTQVYLDVDPNSLVGTEGTALLFRAFTVV